MLAKLIKGAKELAHEVKEGVNDAQKVINLQPTETAAINITKEIIIKCIQKYLADTENKKNNFFKKIYNLIDDQAAQLTAARLGEMEQLMSDISKLITPTKRAELLPYLTQLENFISKALNVQSELSKEYGNPDQQLSAQKIDAPQQQPLPEPVDGIVIVPNIGITSQFTKSQAIEALRQSAYAVLDLRSQLNMEKSEIIVRANNNNSSYRIVYEI